MAPTRGPQIRLTFGGKTGKKSGARETTTVKNNKRKRRLPSFSEAESTTSGGESDGESDFDEESEEADDESENPEAEALSHFATLDRGAGPSLLNQESVEFPELGEWTGFPDMSDAEDGPILGTDFEQTLFDSDDDQVYERVNEVSESEHEDDEDVERAETQLLAAEFNDDMTSHFANQIDGMSAYGFGDDSDEEGSVFFPFSSSDEANEAHERRVRFEEQLSIFEQQEVGVPHAFAALGHSPTMTRALLPSALPEKNGGDEEQQAAEPSDDDYDSDATEELEAPAQVWQMSSARRLSKAGNSPPVPIATRTPGQKGPVRGTFEDDGEKATAILDPSGRKLLFSDAHLIGGVFARKYGPSLPASPSNSFASAVLNESDSSQASDSPRPQTAHPLTTVDLMLSGLTSGEHASTDGQATGLPEAFMPADTSFLNNYITADLFGGEDDIAPDGRMQLEDMIVFDMDVDGTESHPESPMATSFLPDTMSAPSTPLAHLNHMNVAAFKRKAEPRCFDDAFPTPMRNKFVTPHKRKRRSTRYDSPYNNAHYQGVTPVQRITYNELPSSPAPSSSHMHKRRKTIL